MVVQLDSAGAFLRWLPIVGPVEADSIRHRSGRMRLNRARFAHDPTTGRFALAYQSTNRVEMYDSSGCLLAVGEGTPKVDSEYVLRRRFFRRAEPFSWSDSVRFGYVGVDATSSRVLALFCGSCSVTRQLPHQVDVFSWFGRNLGSLKLDKPVYAIAVAHNADYIIGAAEEPYPHVAVWKIDQEDSR